MTMVLNRIDSIITGNSFTRNTLAMVMDHITLSEWDDRHGTADNFYRQEALMIDEMFTDVEDDKAYLTTVGALAQWNSTSYQVQQITPNRIFLALNVPNK